MNIFTNKFIDLCESIDFTDLNNLVKYINDNMENDQSYFNADDKNANNKHIFQWPEKFMETKIGNCVDFAYFIYHIYQYYKTKKFSKCDSAILFITIIPTTYRDYINTSNPYRFFGHAIPLVKIDDYIFGINCNVYSDIHTKKKIKDTQILGGFENISFEDISNSLAGYFNCLVTEVTGDSDYIPYNDVQYEQHCTIFDKDMKIIERYYGKDNLVQGDLLDKISKIRKINNNNFAMANHIKNPNIIYTSPKLPISSIIKYFGIGFLSMKKTVYKAFIKSKMFKPLTNR